jgi:cell division protein FtsN
MSAPPSTTISQAPPSSGDRYYVVTDYTGDPSLNQARQAVSDAYVRNFNDGAKVQMGSFTDAASAEQLAQDLQQQGVPAKVYHP